MSNTTTEQRVKDLLVEHLGIAPEIVKPEASLIDDLGADSLDVVELIIAFEEEFEVEVTDDDAENVKTVDDAIKMIDRLANK